MKALPLALLIIQPLIVSHVCSQHKYWRREKPRYCLLSWPRQPSS